MQLLGSEIELKIDSESDDTATQNQHTSVMDKSIVSMECVYSLYFVGVRYELHCNPMVLINTKILNFKKSTKLRGEGAGYG